MLRIGLAWFIWYKIKSNKNFSVLCTFACYLYIWTHILFIKQKKTLTSCTETWTCSKFCNIYNFDCKLLIWLSMYTSANYGKWSPRTKKKKNGNNSCAMNIICIPIFIEYIRYSSKIIEQWHKPKNKVVQERINQVNVLSACYVILSYSLSYFISSCLWFWSWWFQVN